MGNRQKTLENYLESVPVVPVLIVDDATKATTIAETLVASGLHVLEVTLRTEAAFEAINAMTKVKGAIVGAGTLLNANQIKRSKEAGAAFGVSPGSTQTILEACHEFELPLLPGTDNVSTALKNLEHGYTYQKFFPAENSGGIDKLRALYSPLPEIKFCPTGGISAANAADYLSLPNVCCVGGSWVAPEFQIETNSWAEIKQLASQAAQLG